MDVPVVKMAHGLNDLFRFLKGYKTMKSSSFTHTSIANPAGSFYVPKDAEKEFFRLYAVTMKAGDPLHLTEKHNDFAPILIDIDLRFPIDTSLIRHYKEDDLETIANIYVHVLSKFVIIPSDGVTVYVMEKESPSLTPQKNFIKDGIHMVIPGIVTRPAVQHMIRTEVMELLRPVFKKMGASNDITDIIDERVIDINNWQMYGSHKVDSTPYAITHIYQYNNTNELVHVPINRNHEEYVELMSIRNKHCETLIVPERIAEIDAFESRVHAEREKKKHIAQATQRTPNMVRDEYAFIELARKLVSILNPRRATSYNDWIRVGWCLRTIDYRMLPDWISFSRKSDKFIDGECEKVWNYMRADGLGIGTLHMWAKADDDKAYADIISQDLFELVKKSLSKTHFDVARVVHHMFQHEFICVSVRTKSWYEFKNHRWVQSDCGFSLRGKISCEVFNEYMKANSHFTGLAMAASNDEKAIYAKKAETCLSLALSLKQTSFKESIMKECADVFYNPRFEELLDTRMHLLGFENGVLDLESMEFREGRPEDYISLSTGNNYRESALNDPVTAEVNEFLSKVFTKEDIRDYLLKVLSSCLDGFNREEKFYIWTGVGANGKSKMLELMMHTFGDYYSIMNVTAITGKRVSSNATNSELVLTKGKRMVVMQEPGNDEKMNIGYLKELSGGDVVQGRSLFKEPVKFKPQFKLILACNHLPEVPSATDDGTWRRIRVAEFTSRFVESPDPNKNNEFLIDRELSIKFASWKEVFMRMLVAYYVRYRAEGITEPEDVLTCTKEYQKSNDTISEFVDDRIESGDPEVAFVGLVEVYDDFKDWLRRNNPTMKLPRRKEIQMYFEKTFGKSVRIPRAGWRGYKLKEQMIGEGDDE